MPSSRWQLPLFVAVAGVVAVICVVVDPATWIIVPVWVLGAAYTVGQIRTGYADSDSPVKPGGPPR